MIKTAFLRAFLKDETAFKNTVILLILPVVLFTGQAMGNDNRKSDYIQPADYSYFFNIDSLRPGVFTIRGKKNLGTGFFISPDGFAITCRHVIEDDEDHMAILANNEEHPIGIIASSSRYDLAVILVTTHKKTPYLQLSDPFSVESGEPVYALGSASGLEPVVTNGLFTAIRKRVPGNDRVIQFSAPVNPGNSGGPLLDKSGRVLGVISWILISDKGLPVADTGFAVPSGYLIEEYGRYLE